MKNIITSIAAKMAAVESPFREIYNTEEGGTFWCK